MHTPTRLLILDYLRKQQTASVRDLSHSLNMTGANIRHHLAVLESNALIELIRMRKDGRGRPENVYALSRRVLGDGLDGLAGAMVEVWLRNEPENVKEADLRSLALRLAGEKQTDPGVLLPQRLNCMVDRLNELHYQARWEASLEGPVIILGHCPYAAIIEGNPELCRMDLYLLEESSGFPVSQSLKLQAGAKGYPYCTFRLKA